MESHVVQTSWFDLGALGDLRSKSGATDKQSATAAAQHFESMFLGIMLKEMRKTVEHSGLLQSEAMDTYQQMFDQQVSLNMAKAGGIGLASYLSRQMAAQAGAPAAVDAKAPQGGFVIPTAEALQLRKPAGP